jgi:hypothetical protein
LDNIDVFGSLFDMEMFINYKNAIKKSMNAKKMHHVLHSPRLFIEKYEGPSMIGVPHLNLKDSFQGLPNSFFSSLFP